MAEFILYTYTLALVAVVLYAGREHYWQMLAWVLARPAVAAWLIQRAARTPYTDIVKDGRIYMRRFWLFNPISPVNGRPLYSWLPSIRVHNIRRPDDGPDPHNHPWPCRTIILRGGYWERRGVGSLGRSAGQTAAIAQSEYHRIEIVGAAEPCWTLFITFKYSGGWGFRVGGRHVSHREYLNPAGYTDRSKTLTGIEP